MKTLRIIKCTCEMKFDPYATTPGCAVDDDWDPRIVAVFDNMDDAMAAFRNYHVDIRDYHSCGLVLVTEYAVEEGEDGDYCDKLCGQYLQKWPEEIEIDGTEYVLYTGWRPHWVEKEKAEE